MPSSPSKTLLLQFISSYGHTRNVYQDNINSVTLVAQRERSRIKREVGS